MYKIDVYLSFDVIIINKVDCIKSHNGFKQRKNVLLALSIPLLINAGQIHLKKIKKNVWNILCTYYAKIIKKFVKYKTNISFL